MTPIIYPYHGDDPAADWLAEAAAYAPRHDEWNAMRLSRGLIADTFEEYIACMKSGERKNQV